MKRGLSKLMICGLFILFLTALLAAGLEWQENAQVGDAFGAESPRARGNASFILLNAMVASVLSLRCYIHYSTYFYGHQNFCLNIFEPFILIICHLFLL